MSPPRTAAPAVPPISCAICWAAANVSKDMRFQTPPRCSITARIFILLAPRTSIFRLIEQQLPWDYLPEAEYAWYAPADRAWPPSLQALPPARRDRRLSPP